MIDLHVHTKASDGEFTPSEIIEKAIKEGVTTIAITDHDTIDGLEEAIEYSKNKEINVVQGIELNAKVEKGQMHIVGLNIDYLEPEFKTKIDEIKKERNERNDKLIEKFNEMGVNITLDEVKEFSFGEIVAKPHFAKVLLKKGYIKDIEEAFDLYFNKSPLNEIKRQALSPKTAIELIKKANGKAILAHPQTLKLTPEELEIKVKELKEMGLDGMECYHSRQTSEEMKIFKEIAQRNNLLISKGSDYHGPVTTPDIQVGVGKKGNIVNEEENTIVQLLNK